MVSLRGHRAGRRQARIARRDGFHRRLVTLAAFTCALAIAACGSSSGKGQATAHNAFVAYSDCVRSHGVPNFPDPGPGGGIHLSAGINPQSPAFKSAQQACTKWLPGGGPGSQHPSEQNKIQMLAVSECMRRHGVSGFPDPTLSPPSSPAGYSLLENRGGVVLAIPNTINMGSPVFKQAAAACEFH